MTGGTPADHDRINAGRRGGRSAVGVARPTATHPPRPAAPGRRARPLDVQLLHDVVTDLTRNAGDQPAGEHPQLGGPRRRLRLDGQLAVLQLDRPAVRGDVRRRRPAPTRRTRSPRPSASASRAPSSCARATCRTAADPSGRVPAPYSPRRRRGSPVAGSVPTLRRGCARRFARAASTAARASSGPVCSAPPAPPPAARPAATARPAGTGRGAASRIGLPVVSHVAPRLRPPHTVRRAAHAARRRRRRT